MSSFVNEVSDIYTKIKNNNSSLWYQNEQIKRQDLYLELSKLFLENNLNDLRAIKSNDKRENRSYKVKNHKYGKTTKGNYKEKNFRLEEREVLAIYNFYRTNQVGVYGEQIKVIDYQTPLKNTSDKYYKNTNLGKAVDAIGQDKDGNLYLLEYKNARSEESLLRSVLEVFTYFKYLDEGMNNLKNDFLCSEKCNVLPAILIMEGSTQYQEYKKQLQNKKSPIVKLMKELGVSAFCIHPEKTFNEEDENILQQLAQERPSFDFSITIDKSFI